jgi:hypothetical protein
MYKNEFRDEEFCYHCQQIIKYFLFNLGIIMESRVELNKVHFFEMVAQERFSK